MLKFYLKAFSDYYCFIIEFLFVFYQNTFEYPLLIIDEYKKNDTLKFFFSKYSSFY